MSKLIVPEYVNEHLYQQLELDHYNCTFHPSLEIAPDKIEMMRISMKGQFRFICASTSVTQLEGKIAVERWYHPAQNVRFFDIHDNGNRVNRYWAKMTYPRQRAQPSDNTTILLPPRLSIPGHYRDMAQIDIKSAYYSIMNIVGLYPRVEWGIAFGVGSKLEPGYPFSDYKTVRNSLYGTVFNPRLTYVTRGVGRMSVPKTRVSNPHLMHVVQTILHGIAREAKLRGCVQWYTDGGIIPYANVWGFMEWIADNYGLSCKLKSVGEATIIRPDQYITEIHSPKRRIGVPQYIDTIDGFREDYPYGKYEGWLQRKVRRWAKIRAEPYIEDLKGEKWLYCW